MLTSVQGSSTVNTGADATTIDVMNPSLKTKFVVGTGTGVEYTTLGEVVVSRANVGTVALPATASALGTGATANVNAGLFQFAAASADKLKLTLTVPSDAAFKGFYATQGACSATIPAATGTTPVFAKVTGSTDYTATADINAVTGAAYNLCAVVKGDAKIDAQTIGLKSQIDLAGALTVDPPAVTTAAFHVLKYNGSVAKVDHFNPASNATQISYLRIINPSSSDGLVHIEGICDDGTAQPAISLNLEAGKAVLRTAQQLKTDGLVQCSTGKSRLIVTGEFAGMRVQNFLRNVTADGSQINTNVNTNDMNTSSL
ncbi:hypothetical protein ASF01_16040 [Stenotrophomonas sp. Leaf70]|nr:hypothetical protein ASF01_16040 [Stenotrophomonas sp. Leaf70]